MKWSDKKLYMPRGKEYYKTARKRNYRARCECVDRDHVKYFFYILRKDDYVYISIKHGHAYDTEADCMTAAEKHIDGMTHEYDGPTIEQLIELFSK